ncbi:cobalamin biosynthesis protein [Rhodococcus sp. HNM0569]|nr:cobalamin biosynthesis protein [Rhodococcus sp. HNM0569]
MGVGFAPVWVGVGFASRTHPGVLAAAVRAVADELGTTLAGLSTLAHKAPALDAVARELGVPVRAFEAAELAAVETESRSARADAAVGTPSVAEAAAILASGGGRVVRAAHIRDGVVVAAAVE